MSLSSRSQEKLASIRLRAPAKINLTLAVLGKRPDGYHEIESLVLPTSLHDELEIVEANEPGVNLRCDDPSIPTGRENVIIQAAERLVARCDEHRGASIRLTKRIPVGAGLGGGSSDAAATLIGLNRLWRLGLSTTDLAGIAAEVGSDVPLFLTGGPVVIRGRGEQVRPCALGWLGWIVLIIPPFGLSTAAVYRQWRPGPSPPHSAAEVVESIRSGQPIGGLLYNMLEAPAFAVEPRLANLHARLTALGAPNLRMSGSGSALFALFEKPEPAEKFAGRAACEAEVTVHVMRTTT